ncbi:hypothetical protein NX801_02940 [Streptomyces sp. LP05-1]|uniref:Gram-positive cocci surface proteins LPxTG domain-containing protein n=1 Tax=Streptomyces pyxinae TaxID=2970734 RepID=A0ABT2CB38_9ACTN|nr:hypothetical protein [Streptomyces sp. LP05-1]MCS0634629.1 hypothetical protein [Streptomyces sp. LP05-1]
MRLRTALATAATATAALLAPLGPAGAAHGTPGDAPRTGQNRPPAVVAVPEREPACGDVAATTFPIGTRITGGPDSYQPGGGFRTWRVELTNTTAQPCRNIHPVVVLTDRDRSLRPAQIQLEFQPLAEGSRPEDSRTEGDRTEGPGTESSRSRPVTFEQTDRNELVGVLDDGLPGFTVPAHGTVTVPVRLAFTSDARPDEVTAAAAIVQRRGRDGDWVGESDAYRFVLADGDPVDETAGELPRTGRDLVAIGVGAAAVVLLGAGALLLAARLRGRKD